MPLCVSCSLCLCSLDLRTYIQVVDTVPYCLTSHVLPFSAVCYVARTPRFQPLSHATRALCVLCCRVSTCSLTTMYTRTLRAPVPHS
ncbi:hypothetical protein BD413DRAFT_262820 [Trametes elegans]|nr:hypothetical protein BD413DRAFT_262820 [Trametes elegans]